MMERFLARILVALHEWANRRLVSVAENPAADPRALELIATLRDHECDTSVSMNPNSPIALLELMLERSAELEAEALEWRKHILGNPALTTEVLMRLADHEGDVKIREFALERMWERLRSPATEVIAEHLVFAYKRFSEMAKSRPELQSRANLLREHPLFPRDGGR